MKDIVSKLYDLVIIGSGTAAQVASGRVRAAGWSVAVIDDQPYGGTCALRGCDPKRMLISGAEALDAVSRMRGHGVEGQPRINWRELMAFKRSFTEPIPHAQEQHYIGEGIDAFHGLARFTGPDALTVGGQALKSRYILIASGALPVPLHIPGEEYLTTSDRFLELDALPARVVFVGGGYIAAEFSHLAARAGARVTVLQRAERMLPAFDADLVGWLMEKFHGLGIDVRTHSTVHRIEKTAGGYHVHATTDGRADIVAADLVVHAAGRIADLEPLHLDVAGVTIENGRLKLNEYLQSVSNPKVYAAGDVASSGPPLTPVAGHDGAIVAANLLDGNRHKPDYCGVPSVAFTSPPIAAVGLSETQARSKGLKFRMKSQEVPDWYTARRLNESVYGFKTLVEEDTDRILGAHLVGPHAEEVINLFALAIRHELTTKDIKTTMFAYPTSASDIGYML